MEVFPYSSVCPLDVHSGNVARKLGLLTRKQNDGKAVAELDAKLRKLDPTDPVKCLLINHTYPITLILCFFSAFSLKNPNQIILFCKIILTYIVIKCLIDIFGSIV
jgi:hypothetical protein